MSLKANDHDWQWNLLNSAPLRWTITITLIFSFYLSCLCCPQMNFSLSSKCFLSSFPISHTTNTFTPQSKGRETGRDSPHLTSLTHQWQIQALTPNPISHFPTTAPGSNQNPPTKVSLAQVSSLKFYSWHCLSLFFHFFPPKPLTLWAKPYSTSSGSFSTFSSLALLSPMVCLVEEIQNLTPHTQN